MKTASICTFDYGDCAAVQKACARFFTERAIHDDVFELRIIVHERVDQPGTAIRYRQLQNIVTAEGPNSPGQGARSSARADRALQGSRRNDDHGDVM